MLPRDPKPSSKDAKSTLKQPVPRRLQPEPHRPSPSRQSPGKARLLLSVVTVVRSLPFKAATSASKACTQTGVALFKPWCVVCTRFLLFDASAMRLACRACWGRSESPGTDDPLRQLWRERDRHAACCRFAHRSILEHTSHTATDGGGCGHATRSLHGLLHERVRKLCTGAQGTAWA